MGTSSASSGCDSASLSLGAGTLPPDLDGGVLFSMLIASLRNASAMILDGSGVVQWCCPRCAPAYGCKDAIVGRLLASLTPAAWADERTACVARACAEQRTLTLVGIVSGIRVLTRVIPLPGGGTDTPARALLVIEQASPEEVDRLVASGREGGVVWSTVHDLGPLDALTVRELEVLALLGKGQRTKEIAETLHRSVSTIDGHRERIGQKLGLNDRAELVSVARRAGLRMEDAEGSRVHLRTDPN
jgi:DNA-binding CsgD family transcriptional regulator